jgi:hypothetical protein
MRFDADLVAEESSKPFHDRKAETEPFRTSRTAVDLVKLFEYPADFVGRNAEASVVDFEHKSRALPRAAHPYLADARVPNGVADQIHEDSL